LIARAQDFVHQSSIHYPKAGSYPKKVKEDDPMDSEI
jgi:hypothetical protein